mgnify:CR=1 FL=1
MTIEREKLDELTCIIEDTVDYASDQWDIPSLTIWTVIDALAEAKLAELNKLASLA